MITFNKEKGIFTSSLIPIPHGFGTKQFGDGRSKPSIISQTHSANILLLKEIPTITVSNYDGVITRLPHITLSVITADCVPIIFYDPINQLIGISHQGWKGTLEQLPKKMILNLTNLGSKVANIKVAIGPAINECCYEISKDLAAQFSKKLGSKFITKTKSNYYLNLLKINYQQLIAAEIQPQHIDYFPFCTSCNQKLFWSNRREKGINGEMYSFIEG